jgi:hypothetical protein
VGLNISKGSSKGLIGETRRRSIIVLRLLLICVDGRSLLKLLGIIMTVLRVLLLLVVEIRWFLGLE